MAKDASINLLRKKQHAAGLHVFIEWLLTYGRLIIIIIQIIALTALLYRYLLDRELETVYQKIKTNQAIIEDRKDKEDTYRNLHERLALIATTQDAGEKSKDLFVATIATASGYLVFNNVSLDKNTMRIESYTPSVALLNTFVKKLREDERIDSVSIDNVENKTSSAIINITLSTSIKKGNLISETL